jgi:hypothetical protein
LPLPRLRDHETEVAAIRCLADVGGPEHAQAVADLAANSRSIDVLGASVRALDGWSSRAPGREPRWMRPSRACRARAV